MVSVTEATAMGGCRKRTALCSILLLLPHYKETNNYNYNIINNNITTSTSANYTNKIKLLLLALRSMNNNIYK